MLAAPEQATAFLRNIRNRLTEPAAQTTIDALTAAFAMNAGNPQRARHIADEVLAAPTADDPAVAWAASATSLCAARMGRFSDVESMAARAFDAEHPGLLRFTVGLAQTTTLLMTGDSERAIRVAQQGQQHLADRAAGLLQLGEVGVWDRRRRRWNAPFTPGAHCR
jgi:hypothetical protein